MSELSFYSRSVLTPHGAIAGTVVVQQGRVAAVHEGRAEGAVDLGDSALLPGVVDSHVHVNEPGRTEWEGFATATRAAAAGGITTLVDMPLNSTPVTTSLAALEAKRRAAEGQLWVDVAFWGGVVPGNLAELEPMIDAGIAGFKAFTCHSGIDDFPQSGEADLRAAMTVLARHNVPLLVHAELEHPVEAGGDPRAYATFLASRPPSFEVAAVRQVIRLCRETGCRVHIVHLSAADALAEIAEAKREGLPLSVETCPHYLVFAAEEIPDGATEYKCCPPIREAANRERLWQGLRDGTIDFVACDHSPCTAALKLPGEGDFLRAWGGIASVQFSLPVVWTAASARGFGLEDVVRWLCGRTAAFAGLAGAKGAIAPGLEADLVVFAPERPFVVESHAIQFKNKLTPYLGRPLKGVVEATYLRGERIYAAGEFSAPAGRMRRREAFVEK